METIKLAAVLAEIEQYERDGTLHTFSIRYVKQNGQLGEKPRVRKSGAAPQGATTESAGGKFRYNVKQRGVLVLTNCDTDKPFSVVIRRLTHYNGQQIWH